MKILIGLGLFLTGVAHGFQYRCKIMSEHPFFGDETISASFTEKNTASGKIHFTDISYRLGQVDTGGFGDPADMRILVELQYKQWNDLDHFVTSKTLYPIGQQRIQHEFQTSAKKAGASSETELIKATFLCSLQVTPKP